MAAWHAQGHELAVSVNIPRRQLGDELMADVRRALSASGLDTASLTLEITESTLGGEARATVRPLGAAAYLETLDERVEEPARLRAVSVHRNDQGQGVLFAHPLEPAELEAFLEAPGQEPLASRGRRVDVRRA